MKASFFVMLIGFLITLSVVWTVPYLIHIGKSTDWWIIPLIITAPFAFLTGLSMMYAGFMVLSDPRNH